MHPIMVHIYIDDSIFQTSCSISILQNLKVTALLENGMYYIPVRGMYASYIYTDIMHASYYGACTGDYACSIFSF